MLPTTDTAGERIASRPEAEATAAGTRASTGPRTVVGRAWQQGASPTDEELLLAFVKGDVQAFAALYDRMAGLVDHNVYRLLGQGAHPQELFRATFLDMWRDAARFDPAKGTVRRWVLTNLALHAMDLGRSEPRSPARIDDAEGRARPERR